VITGYAATIDPARYGYGLAAYTYLKISRHIWKSYGSAGRPALDRGRALVSGEFDMVLLVRTRDATSLRDLVSRELQGMPDVLSTQTVLIFAEMAPSQGAAAQVSTIWPARRGCWPGSRSSETAEGVLGINPESTRLVALVVAASAALAGAVWWRPDRRLLVLALLVAASAVVFDIAELSHRITLSDAPVATFAALVGAGHLIILAVAARLLAARREQA
jgi:hypothetical protein